MIITKKRIRSLRAYTKGLVEAQPLVVCVSVSDIDTNTAIDIGFSPDLLPGESVLPKAVGNITTFNAEGKEIPLKDKPKETHYRQQEWTWKEFRGRYDFEERSRIVDIPYERYPRKFIEPPAIEFNVATNAGSEKLIVSDSVEFLPKNDNLIIHVINLFLEIFGYCEIRNAGLDSIIRAPLRKLNWDVLPPGKKPWGELKPLVREATEHLSDGNKVVIDKRLESINVHEPDFVAVGRAGFTGYLIFGFPEKSLYILESTQTNNATYVIENNWEVLSGLTKAEILENDLHKERVIHRESWFNEINRILCN
ncbi:hypothetical protein [uncultured Halomonas sp.]|uniref:hypothetical protein n=1 Tax=uncultured Halomonas sp. TaxID=173971 RepID=UPI002603BA0F|nr:hypothetical protein [uncultured Halomonas sp.]